MIHPVLFVLIGGVAATPLANGDFERGLEGWGTQNSWYERPKARDWPRWSWPRAKGATAARP